jgi:hypothetical protein
VQDHHREPERVSLWTSLSYTSFSEQGTKEVLSTEFSAKLGETVVVGTSRVKGDESLVLLITPLAPKTAAGETKDTREVFSVSCELKKDGKVLTNLALHTREGQSGGVGVGDGVALTLTPKRLDAHRVSIGIVARRGAESVPTFVTLTDEKESPAEFAFSGTTYALKLALLPASPRRLPDFDQE